MILRLAASLVVMAACTDEAWASEAQRHAECDVDVRDTPTLEIARLPSARFRMVTEPIGWERDDSGQQVELVNRHGEETATLQGGVRLRVELGGCETYSNSYEFSLPGVPPSDVDGGWWLRKASALLKEVEPASCRFQEGCSA